MNTELNTKDDTEFEGMGFNEREVVSFSTKSYLIACTNDAIKAALLTKEEVRERLSIPPHRVESLLRGYILHFHIEDLLGYLDVLGYSVTFKVEKDDDQVY